MNSEKETTGQFPGGRRNLYRTAVFLVFALFVGGALAIPFYFETQTLWYKTGIGKSMLRAGQLAGMLALVLIFVQITLALRSRLLEKLFGVANLLRWHRINGAFIGVLALGHVFLVLAPEGLANLPIGKKYWPEMVGMLLFLILVPLVVSSHFRQRLKLDYGRWKAVHRVLGYLVILLVTVHALYVSESFEHESLQVTLLALFGALIVQVVMVKRLFDASSGQRTSGYSE
ncbi:MAG: ferric reductase-like transmembrane domain-containing protein [Desulfofustis sp.]|nr:ferric reductase-like transmembrane domain-containing protein [Desulfofustis sp.]